MVLGNWEYLQKKNHMAIILEISILPDFLSYMDLAIFLGKKNILNKYSKLICHENFPKILSSA